MTDGPVLVTPVSRVQVAKLARRRDGDEWIIGRVDDGPFVAVPPVAVEAIDLLEGGLSVQGVQDRLADRTGTGLDIARFVGALADMGMVQEIDGHVLTAPRPGPPSLAWLRERHVAWVLHPAVTLAWAGLCLAAAACLVNDPSLLPGRRDLIWSRSESAVLLGNAALAWTIILLHELAHLVTARAAGVPGRMSLSTRLQFLTAQTDVTGVWASPRRTRLTVYLAGIAVNLGLAGAGLLLVAAHPAGPTARVAAAVVLMSLLFIPSQALVFMRTDLYFVLQDVTGCRNLYADAMAFGRYRARRCWHWRTRWDGPTDPSQALSARERRTVRTYCALMLTGTAACVAVAVTVTVPVVATVLGNAVHTLVRGAPRAESIDAAAVLMVTGGVQALWARAWWRKHGHRLRRRARSHQISTEGR